MAKHKPDVRFLISTERNTWSSSTSYSLKLRVVVVNSKGEVLNPGHFYRDDPDYATNVLNDFCVTALADDDLQARWYGWQYRFVQPYEVDEARAAAMLKLLRSVRAKLERFDRDLDRPESIEAFAMRVARALGATTDHPFGWHSREIAVNGTNYTWHDADGLRWKLDQTTSGKLAPTSQGRG